MNNLPLGSSYVKIKVNKNKGKEKNRHMVDIYSIKNVNWSNYMTPHQSYLKCIKTTEGTYE